MTARYLPALALLAFLATGATAAERSSDLFKDFSTGSKEPIQVEADTLEVAEKDAARVSTFRGNVTIKRGATTVKAAAVAIHSDTEKTAKKSGETFNRIEATGGVWVNSANQTATGERAVVDMLKRTVVLSGKVYLTQGENIISGERLTIYLDSGRATIEHGEGGRIRGMFTPGSGSVPGPAKPTN